MSSIKVTGLKPSLRELTSFQNAQIGMILIISLIPRHRSGICSQIADRPRNRSEDYRHFFTSLVVFKLVLSFGRRGHAYGKQDSVNNKTAALLPLAIQTKKLAVTHICFLNPTQVNNNEMLILVYPIYDIQ